MAAWRKNERIEPTFGHEAEPDDSEIRVSADDRAVVAANDRRSGGRGAPREIEGRAARREGNSRDLGSGGRGGQGGGSGRGGKGGGGGAGQNTGQGFVNFVPWDDRPGSENTADAIVERALGAFRNIRDAQVFASVPGAVRGLGQSNGFNLQLQNSSGMSRAQFAAARDRHQRSVGGQRRGGTREGDGGNVERRGFERAQWSVPHQSPAILEHVAKRLDRRRAPDEPLERAAELKALLAECIARLKPRSPGGGDFGTSDEWRHYNALYFPYVAGLKPYSSRATHDGLDPASRAALDWFQTTIPERTLHNWQNAAAKLIAQDLRARHAALPD